MRFGGFQYGLWLAAMILFIAATRSTAQTLPTGGHASVFTNDMYYPHPNEQQVQIRFFGGEASPLPGGALDVKDLKVETYTTNGTLQLVARAPQCTYAVLHGDASSPTHLDMDSGDGKFHLDGDGFHLVLKKNATSLTVSNHVHTVIQSGLLPP